MSRYVSKGRIMLRFTLKYGSLHEVLTNHKLAALGDAYVNFIFSLAESKKSGEPVGARVDNTLLAGALKKAGLRELLPSRTNRHEQADAAEALIVYAWIRDVMTIEEGVSILEQVEDPAEAFCALIRKAVEKLNLKSINYR
jgi:hypothetical protein